MDATSESLFTANNEFSQGRCNPKSEEEKSIAYSSGSNSFWRDTCPLLRHMLHDSEKEEEKRYQGLVKPYHPFTFQSIIPFFKFLVLILILYCKYNATVPSEKGKANRKIIVHSPGASCCRYEKEQ